MQSDSMDSNTGEIYVDGEDTVDHSGPTTRIKGRTINDWGGGLGQKRGKKLNC